MADLLGVWLLLLLALVALVAHGGKEGGALTLAYFLGLSLIHAPGLLSFINPNSGISVAGQEETRIGFGLTLIAMAAFIVGAATGRYSERRQASPPSLSSLQVRTDDLERLGWRALAVGAASYFVFLPIAGLVPSLTSVVSAFPTLLILGLWLRLYSASLTQDPVKALQIAALLPVLPLSTLVAGGFVGFGVNWVLAIIGFQFVITRRRIWFYLCGPLALLLGLSLFVTYMGQRTGIRDVVWQEHATFVDRLERTSAIVTEFKIIDLNDPSHVAALNGRLNQNFLVGAAMKRLQSGAVGLAYGSTIEPWALIPRAIWPNKPAVGGGRTVVTRFTGIRFAEGTSVGAGQVLEFYMNFGLAGVVGGFGFLGFVLMKLDLAIMRAITSSDMQRLVGFAMPGLCLLQPGGNLLEIFVSVVAAIASARLIFALPFFRMLFDTSSSAPAAPRQRRGAGSLS